MEITSKWVNGRKTRRRRKESIDESQFGLTELNILAFLLISQLVRLEAAVDMKNFQGPAFD